MRVEIIKSKVDKSRSICIIDNESGLIRAKIELCCIDDESTTEEIMHQAKAKAHDIMGAVVDALFMARGEATGSKA